MTDTPQKTQDEWGTLLETLHTLPDQDMRSKIATAVEAITHMALKTGTQENVSEKARKKLRRPTVPKDNEDSASKDKKPIDIELHNEAKQDQDQDDLDQEFERY